MKAGDSSGAPARDFPRAEPWQGPPRILGMSVLLVALVASVLLTTWLVHSAARHAVLFADFDTTGPQKFHRTPVPRVGGIGVLAGLACGALALRWHDAQSGDMALALLASGLPAFAAGIAEDVTKSVSPRSRLFFTAASAVVAAILLGAVIRRTDIPGLDWLVTFGAVSLLLTVLAVTGVANAINLIDGFNGLASMCVLMMLLALCFVSLAVGDSLVLSLALAGLGSVLGFFVWNYPSGRIFLGDGGAYFLGFFVAELGVLLLVRNPAVSPMFPLMLVIYPVFETVFSMYRRCVLKGRPMGLPDGVHLHSLIYRRFVHGDRVVGDKRSLTARNSMTSPYLWVLCGLSIGPAMIWWRDSVALVLAILAFGLLYVSLYWRIVRFRSPRWLSRRR